MAIYWKGNYNFFFRFQWKMESITIILSRLIINVLINNAFVPFTVYRNAISIKMCAISPNQGRTCSVFQNMTNLSRKP